MKLPVPPLLLVTDRHQARRPLAEIVATALAAGCRWVSLREKDLPEDEQVPLARALLAMTQRRHAAPGRPGAVLGVSKAGPATA